MRSESEPSPSEAELYHTRISDLLFLLSAMRSAFGGLRRLPAGGLGVNSRKLTAWASRVLFQSR